MPKANADLDQLAAALDCRVCASRNFSRIEHVNIQEAKAMANELRRVATLLDGQGVRRVCLTDSMVALGAWGKGRSSSRPLNNVLRGVFGWSVLGRVKFIPLWISTHVNPADHPSPTLRQSGRLQ